MIKKVLVLMSILLVISSCVYAHYAVDFDTAKYAVRLERAGISREQSNAFTFALEDVIHEVKYRHRH